MKIEVNAYRSDELRNIMSDIRVKEYHRFELSFEKPFKENEIKQEIFMGFIRLIKRIKITEWKHTFEIELKNFKLLSEVNFYIIEEFNKCFKATEKAYEELR